MAYKFRYIIYQESQLTARSDGSGCVDHQITAESLEVDEQGDPIPDAVWTVVPARSKTFVMPAAQMQLALGQSTTNQKVRAYKDMLVQYADNQAVPITGWSEQEMTDCLDNNVLSAAARDELFAFLDTLGPAGDFPLSFQLDL